MLLANILGLIVLYIMVETDAVKLLKKREIDMHLSYHMYFKLLLCFTFMSSVHQCANHCVLNVKGHTQT